MFTILIGLVIGLVLGVLIGYYGAQEGRKGAQKGSGDPDESAEKKAENIKKIESFIADKDRFTNDDLQKLLGISNTTTGRYLEEMEQAGKITQHGDIGKSVYYTRK